MKDVLAKVRKSISSRVFIDYNRNYRNTTFLAGTGRSGTTWVTNIINYRNNYRYIFEPFNPYRVKICQNFKYRQYLRPNNRGRDFLNPAFAILTGRVKGVWMDSHNTCFISNKRLIKDIRANHILKWIHDNFLEVRLILLLRHPCAVASSKLKLVWGTHLEEFLSQEDLMEDFLYPFKGEIENANSVFEKHIFLWCIENYVPLKQFRSDDIHLAFYENFCECPEYEIDRLFSFLGETYDKRIFEMLDKPSSQIRNHSALISGENLVNGWKKSITADQIRRSNEILSLFGLEGIYDHNSIPNINNAYAIMDTS